MAVQGSEVVLPCEARGSPLPLVSWMKDGEPLLPQSLEQGPGLKLEAVTVGDSGTYSCMAASEAGEARRSFQLTVMGGYPLLSSFSGWSVRESPGGLGSPLSEAPCLPSYCG